MMFGDAALAALVAVMSSSRAAIVNLVAFCMVVVRVGGGVGITTLATDSAKKNPSSLHDRLEGFSGFAGVPVGSGSDAQDISDVWPRI